MRLSALLLSSVAALGLVAPLAGPSARAVPSIHRAPLNAASCPDVWFLGARGSGEGESPSTHGMGKEVDYMRSVVEAKAKAEGMTFTWLPNTYSADSVNDLIPSASELLLLRGGVRGITTFLVKYELDNLDKYDASVAQGIAVAKVSVHTVLARCPNAQILMAGYSQGAIVTHDVENFLAQHDQGEFSTSSALFCLATATGFQIRKRACSAVHPKTRRGSAFISTSSRAATRLPRDLRRKSRTTMTSSPTSPSVISTRSRGARRQPLLTRRATTPPRDRSSSRRPRPGWRAR